MSLHATPKGRPVHPECGAASSGLCRCTSLWEEWMGGNAALRKKIKAARLNELRSNPHTIGAQSTNELDDYVPEEELDEEFPAQGAWELSKFLDQLPGPCVKLDPHDPALKESLDRLRNHIASRGYWDDD